MTKLNNFYRFGALAILAAVPMFAASGDPFTPAGQSIAAMILNLVTVVIAGLIAGKLLGSGLSVGGKMLAAASEGIALGFLVTHAQSIVNWVASL